MRTPTHLVISALVLGRTRYAKHWPAITTGALMPDLPMFGFFFYQRIILDRPPREIWSQAYFEPHWQHFFDSFNSLPLIALGIWGAWRLRCSAGTAFFLSMAIHCLADLPVHNDDAHGHFFPLTDWRFASPISYWDPQFHGDVFRQIETVFLMVGSATLLFAYRGAWRVVGGLMLVLQLATWTAMGRDPNQQRPPLPADVPMEIRADEATDTPPRDRILPANAEFFLRRAPAGVVRGLASSHLVVARHAPGV